MKLLVTGDAGYIGSHVTDLRPLTLQERCVGRLCARIMLNRTLRSATGWLIRQGW